MIAPLVALLFLVSPALAKKTVISDEPVKPAAECVSPASVLKSSKAELRADLKGEELKRFNANYERIAKTTAPDVEEVLVYNYGREIVMLLGFREGCGVGVALLSTESFDKYNSSEDNTI